MGIGFAIPISLAVPVIESVNNGGHILRPWIGLQVETLPVKVAYALGFDHPYGVVVKKVYPEGPADKAGLEVGDVIVAFDGHTIENGADLDYQVGISSVGKKAEIKIARKGEEKKLPVVLSVPMSAKDPSTLNIEGANPLHGSQIRNLSPALAIDMGLSPMEQGVVVSEVAEAGAAARLGIKPGDILESINQKSIKTKEDAIGMLNNLSHSWTVVLRRGNKVLAFQAGV
jgi:serine protease Do